MTIKTTEYLKQIENIPEAGRVILAHQTEDEIVVYQAYNSKIAEYAVANQKFGGEHFSYNRMSWIKPNFLWMMYRCGWAQKENQENVLAIWIKKSDFDLILSQAVYSSYQEHIYRHIEDWKGELQQSDVRLQWDPDHDPFGKKLERRAIQLGIRGNALKAFGENMIQKIENITDFVTIQKRFVDTGSVTELSVPNETRYRAPLQSLNDKLGID